MSSPSPSPDAGRMRFRKLRLAWSVVCIVLCVLLLELWLRSYWWGDRIAGYCSNVRQFELYSEVGSFALIFWNSDQHFAPDFQSYRMTEPAERWPLGLVFSDDPTDGISVSFSSPYWLAVVGVLILIAAPWFKHRFSLRTLLIATTLVAAMLALIVRAAKS